MISRAGGSVGRVTGSSAGLLLVTFIALFVACQQQPMSVQTSGGDPDTSITYLNPSPWTVDPVTRESLDSIPAEIELTTDRSFISVRGSGGVSRAYIKLKALTKRGLIPLGTEAIRVKIAIVRGPGGGERLSDSVVTLGANGTGTVALIAGTRSGTVVLRASIVAPKHARSVSLETSILTITGGPPDVNHFLIAAEQANLWGWDYIGTPTTVCASVADRYGNPVPPGYVVNFWTTGGKIEGSGVTDEAGNACVTLWAQGSTKQPDPLGATDPTDFTPWRSDLDLRRYFDSTLVAGTTVAGMVMRDSSVKVDPAVNPRGEGSRTGDGQAIIFASIADDGAVYGDGTTDLIWDTAMVVFSGLPYGPYGTTINGVPGSVRTIMPQSTITIECFLTDINGNPLVGGTTVKAETSLDNVALEQNFSTIDDARCGYQVFRLRITDKDPQSRLRGEARIISRIAGKDIRGVAPAPAELVALADNPRFDFHSGTDGPLTLVVNGTSHAVPLGAGDSTRQAVAGHIGELVPGIVAIAQGHPDSSGALLIRTLGVGGDATLLIPESSSAVAAKLGFQSVGVVQTGNDTTRLRIIRHQDSAGSSQTVTFTRADTTLENIARTIQREVDSVHVAIDDGEIALSTWTVGEEAGIEIDPHSTANRIFSFPALVSRGKTTREEIWITVGHPDGEKRFLLAELTFY